MYIIQDNYKNTLQILKTTFEKEQKNIEDPNKKMYEDVMKEMQEAINELIRQGVDVSELLPGKSLPIEDDIYRTDIREVIENVSGLKTQNFTITEDKNVKLVMQKYFAKRYGDEVLVTVGINTCCGFVIKNKGRFDFMMHIDTINRLEDAIKIIKENIENEKSKVYVIPGNDCGVKYEEVLEKIDDICLVQVIDEGKEPKDIIVDANGGIEIFNGGRAILKEEHLDEGMEM